MKPRTDPTLIIGRNLDMPFKLVATGMLVAGSEVEEPHTSAPRATGAMAAGDANKQASALVKSVASLKGLDDDVRGFIASMVEQVLDGSMDKTELAENMDAFLQDSGISAKAADVVASMFSGSGAKGDAPSGGGGGRGATKGKRRPKLRRGGRGDGAAAVPEVD